MTPRKPRVPAAQRARHDVVNALFALRLELAVLTEVVPRERVAPLERALAEAEKACARLAATRRRSRA